jgi:hypothetical protein
MKKFWEQLKPQERRWVAGVGLLFFLVLNYIFIWPRFSQWSQNSARMRDANEKLATYRAELARQPEYDRKIKELESAEMRVPQEDQATHFETSFMDQAIEHGVNVTSKGRLTTRSNDYFLEQMMSFDVNANETNLVELLYNLGASNSMMRVRSMTLTPADPNRYQLHATLVVVASYQKKNLTPPPAAAKPAPAITRPANAGTNKPATGPGAPGAAGGPPGTRPNPANPLTNRPAPSNKKTS